VIPPKLFRSPASYFSMLFIFAAAAFRPEPDPLVFPRPLENPSPIPLVFFPCFLSSVHLFSGGCTKHSLFDYQVSDPFPQSSSPRFCFRSFEAAGKATTAFHLVPFFFPSNSLRKSFPFSLLAEDVGIPCHLSFQSVSTPCPIPGRTHEFIAIPQAQASRRSEGYS